MALTMPRLKAWLDEQGITFTPEQVGSLVGIAATPEPLDGACTAKSDRRAVAPDEAWRDAPLDEGMA